MGGIDLANLTFWQLDPNPAILTRTADLTRMIARAFRLTSRILVPLFMWGIPGTVKERLAELDREIVVLSCLPCFAPENRHHPEQMKHAAWITTVIERLRERAARIESGLE